MTSVTTICSSSQAQIPLNEYTGGIRSRFALSVLFIHWGSSTNNFWLLVVHLAFTTVNSVHLCTTDYLISLSDTDTNSKHLPIADIANRESIHMWEGQLNSLIHIAWQVHVCKCTCAHQTNFASSLSIYKLANARRPVYLLMFLVAKSEIWTMVPGRLQINTPTNVHIFI